MGARVVAQLFYKWSSILGAPRNGTFSTEYEHDRQLQHLGATYVVTYLFPSLWMAAQEQPDHQC